MTIQADILAEYLAECSEKLNKLTLILGEMEKGEANLESLRTFARDVHTIKGSSQLFAFKQISALAHAMEECMDKIQSAGAGVNQLPVDLYYAAVDQLSQMMSVVKTTGGEPPPTPMHDDLIRRLASWSDGPLSTAAGRPEALPPAVQAVVASPLAAVNPAASDSSDASPREPGKDKERDPAAPRGKSPAALDDGPADTIRVNVELLDNLMNLVGELVLVRNRLNQVAQHDNNAEILRVSQNLNVICTELQNDVMKTRMQPIGNVLSKFHRVVRDLSKSVGKRTDLELIGTETELDKTLIEAVKDPLTHIIRNSIDHGLETPDERRRAGKGETGRVSVKACHESGHIIIDIADDGRGLSREKIAAKAIEKGLASAEDVSRMSDREVYQFIFLPGFSTAARVSDLSGRGVGMDVVRTNIEKIGGKVELSSQPGIGTAFSLKIPLTLAIIPALIIRAGGERFAIPQVTLLELIRVSGSNEGDNSHVIEWLQGRPVYRLRGNLLPLVGLNQTLNLTSPSTGAANSDEEFKVWDGRDLNIAVLRSSDQSFGLIVDAIEDSADIVVKPLASFLKDLGIYSGATILGDGEVVLTLDIAGLAQKAEIIGDSASKARERQSFALRTDGDQASSEATEYILVEVAGRRNYAIPMCIVHRLEEFRNSDVRITGDQAVVRYRDSLLPLLHLDTALGWSARQPKAGDSNAVTRNAGDSFTVIVTRRNDHLFGLVVDAIIDVVLSSSEIDTSVRDRDGLIGSLVINSQVITVVDAPAIIQRALFHRDGDAAAAMPSVGDAATGNSAQVRAARGTLHVFLAEDSAFYRRHVSQVLREAGFQVSSAADGALALQALDSARFGTFHALVSDIEMPNMGGYELAQKVRAHKSLSVLPMVALTTRFSKDDVHRGLAAGFNTYLEKLNSDELIGELDHLLGINQEKKHAG